MPLYIVATPIGNLEDISFRALETLKSADLILCEDTRVTKKLLNHFNIHVKTLSYHQHSKISRKEYIIDLLRQRKLLALVSDAGTPGISDPGNKLVQETKHVIPVPGPSALITAASVAGFSMDKFIFMGFPPSKNKRNKFFDQVNTSTYPVILYESPHRIIKTLKQLKGELVVCRELTKKFETIYRGRAEDIIDQVEIRGEFVIIQKPQ